jgi:hypothetical protein
MVWAAVLPTLVCLLLSGLPARGQEGSDKPLVIYDIGHDESQPLRDLAGTATAGSSPQVIPLRQQATASPVAHTAVRPDTVLQRAPGQPLSTSNIQDFEGLAADGVVPPDTNGAAGPTQIVQVVNVQLAVYDKASGTRLLGPLYLNSLWSGFGGLCASVNGGHPIVLYDKGVGRWLISQLAYNSTFTSNNLCVAVSENPDATGSYYRYAFSFGRNLPDSPQFGVWADGYYFSANMFRYGNSYLGAQACAFNRLAMVTGSPANAICFQKGPGDFSLLPSHLDGATPPPSGQPDFYLELGSNGLNLFQFHADFAIPSRSTIRGPIAVSGVAPFTEACGNGGTCIPQGGTTQTLDSLGDRLMPRLGYRNLTNHESLVVNHSVTTTVGSTTIVGVRWYEIRKPFVAPYVYQQGTFAPDTNSRWLGSIGMDKVGDIAVGYSASGASLNPGIRYSGRVRGDPMGMLGGEATAVIGTGSQTGGLSRWGDYSSISIDPSDDCTFWYTNAYLTASGGANWHTRIFSFRFAGCAEAGGLPP